MVYPSFKYLACEFVITLSVTVPMRYGEEKEVRLQILSLFFFLWQAVNHSISTPE